MLRNFSKTNIFLIMALVIFIFAGVAIADIPNTKNTSVLEKLDELENRYVKVKERIGFLKKQYEDLDKKLKDTEKDIEVTREQQKSQKHLLMKRLRESYKLGSVSGYEYLLSSRDFSDFILRGHYLKRLWDGDRKIIEAYNGGINNIRSNQAKIVNQQKKLSMLIGSLDKERKILSERMNERKAYINKIKTEPGLRKQANKEIATAKKNLSKRVASLSHSKEKQKPQIPFEKLKGQMRCPVKAKIEQDFGEVENNEAKIFHGGLDLRAKDGTPVRLPADGTIIFSGRFRGFGNMIVVDHGSKYYTLYAHLKELLWPKGQFLKKGKVVGHVGDSGSIKGSYLYFELRHKGKAINPADWFGCK